MRRTFLAAAVAAALLVPSSASAQAGLSVSPQKNCYLEGETVSLMGWGFTPGASAQVLLNGKFFFYAPVDALTRFSGSVELGSRSGVGVDTFVAQDLANPTAPISASIRTTDVYVRLFRGDASWRQRVKARGFIGGRRLYVHVIRGRRARTVRVGRLQGPCAQIDKRLRIFNPRAGRRAYRVQFDTRKRYSRATRPRVRFRVPVVRRAAASVRASAR